MAEEWTSLVVVCDRADAWDELEPLVLERLGAPPSEVAATDFEQPERKRAASRGVAPAVSAKVVSQAYALSGGLRNVKFVPDSAGVSASARGDVVANWYKKPCLTLYVSRGARTQISCDVCEGVTAALLLFFSILKRRHLFALLPPILRSARRLILASSYELSRSSHARAHHSSLPQTMRRTHRHRPTEPRSGSTSSSPRARRSFQSLRRASRLRRGNRLRSGGCPPRRRPRARVQAALAAP